MISTVLRNINTFLVGTPTVSLFCSELITNHGCLCYRSRDRAGADLGEQDADVVQRGVLAHVRTRPAARVCAVQRAAAVPGACRAGGAARQHPLRGRVRAARPRPRLLRAALPARLPPGGQPTRHRLHGRVQSVSAERVPGHPAVRRPPERDRSRHRQDVRGDEGPAGSAPAGSRDPEHD